MCVAVLSDLAGEPRFAGPTGPDGAYEIDGLGTGTYFVGFFGCNGDHPSAPMPDPAHPGTTYHAQWYSNVWLSPTPDPFGDGATPVEVASGKTTVVNECFDRCNDSIWINGGRSREPHGQARLPLDGAGRVGRSGARGHCRHRPSGRRARIRRHLHVTGRRRDRRVDE